VFGRLATCTDWELFKTAEHLKSSMTVLEPRRGQAVTIRLSEGVHASLQALAAENERSVSAEIRWVLRRYSEYPESLNA
jgi:hypothetical protein